VSPDEQVQPEVFPAAKSPLVRRLAAAEAAGAAVPAAPANRTSARMASREARRGRRRDAGGTAASGYMRSSINKKLTY
jgi:hypothetical protein